MCIGMFKQMVIEHFKPFYEKVDVAHGLDHVIEVMNTALAINHKLRLGISKHDIIVASIAHDIFSYTDRNEHHKKAQEYILSDVSTIYDYVSDRESIAYAVGQHRASYKGEYNNKLSELISAADRGAPNIEKIIKRIYQCAIDPNLVFSIDVKGIPELVLPTGESLSDTYQLLIDTSFTIAEAKTFVHLYEKYSVSGYARYNTVYNKYYNNEMLDFFITIENIAKEPELLRNYITYS